MIIKRLINLMLSSSQKLTFKNTELITKLELKPGVFVISLNKNFSFTSGQCVAIKMDIKDDYRIYSIASGENDDTIDILFDVNPEGFLTPRLAKLEPGNIILVSNPFGNFFTPKGEAWWIGAGTGIAPFISMKRSGFSENKTLIQGAPVKDALYYSTELSGSVGHYIRCCSRENAEGCFNGRVTSWLREQKELPDNIQYLLCGSAEFVVDVRDVLLEKGIKFDKIIAEIYF